MSNRGLVVAIALACSGCIGEAPPIDGTLHSDPMDFSWLAAEPDVARVFLLDATKTVSLADLRERIVVHSLSGQPVPAFEVRTPDVVEYAVEEVLEVDLRLPSTGWFFVGFESLPAGTATWLPTIPGHGVGIRVTGSASPTVTHVRACPRTAERATVTIDGIPWDAVKNGAGALEIRRSGQSCGLMGPDGVRGVIADCPLEATGPLGASGSLVVTVTAELRASAGAAPFTFLDGRTTGELRFEADAATSANGCLDWTP